MRAPPPREELEISDFSTLDEVDVKGKTVLVRVDFNSPINPADGSIMDFSRINEHAKTIGELANKGAKVVVMAHQGRPGDEDFTSLEVHAKALSKALGKEVKFVDEVFGESARSAISSLAEGGILVLENVRFYSEEMIEKDPVAQSKTIMVRKLAPLFDLYVGDAFSVAHRPHVSMVGFPVVLKKVIGRVMQEELEALTKALSHPEHPAVYVLGGAKPTDSLKVADRVLKEGIADLVLGTGMLGQLILVAEGYNVGQGNLAALKKKGVTDEVIAQAKALLKAYPGKLRGPVDVAVERGGKRVDVPASELPVDEPIKDIGEATARSYANVLEDAKTVVINGPAGVYEEPQFLTGTKIIFESVAKGKAFSVLGGGHTISVVDELGLHGKFSHISTAGKAMIDFISGEVLPGIEVLKKRAWRLQLA